MRDDHVVGSSTGDTSGLVRGGPGHVVPVPAGSAPASPVRDDGGTADGAPTDLAGGPEAAPGPARRATIKDVAEAAGVSRSTASRALTGRGYVGLGVRERVQDAAERLGYVPDATARHLKQQVSPSIGVLVTDLRHAFYADLAAGLSRQARRRGYTVMLADDSGSAADELEIAERFVALRVAGVVVTPVSAAVGAYLTRHRVPVVEVDRQFGAGRSDAVVVGDRQASRGVTEHLLGLGHRRIALLVDDLGWTTGRERRAGFEDAHRAAGLPPDDLLVVATRGDVGAARGTAVRLLTRPDAPTAVLAADDVLAEGVWRAAAELGLRVPDDVSLASLDDAPWMSLVVPGVTAVERHAVALGEAAVAQLVERIGRPQAPPRTLTSDAHVVHRGSTAPPRRPGSAPGPAAVPAAVPRPEARRGEPVPRGAPIGSRSGESLVMDGCDMEQ